MNHQVIASLSVGLCAAVALAQPATIDGSRDAAYTTYWNQNIQTGFGDNANELDTLSAMSTLTNLNLFIGGNTTNPNRVELFISTGASGPGGIGGFNNYNGVVFDTSFGAATHYITINRDSGGTMYVDVQTWNGSNWGSNQYLGLYNGTWNASGTPLAGFSAAYNGSNAGGVTGGSGTSSGAGVTTGMEFSIPLSWLGITFSSTINVAGFVVNQNRDFASNQFLGGFSSGSQSNMESAGPGSGNGQLRFNLNNFQGNQYVTIPTPGTAVLTSIGLLAAARRRRV